jgi:hypothetical protein
MMLTTKSLYLVGLFFIRLVLDYVAYVSTAVLILELGGADTRE